MKTPNRNSQRLRLKPQPLTGPEQMEESATLFGPFCSERMEHRAEHTWENRVGREGGANYANNKWQKEVAEPTYIEKNKK